MQRAGRLGKIDPRGVKLEQRGLPVVYKFDSDQSDTTQDELSQVKTEEFEEPPLDGSEWIGLFW